MPRLLLVLLLFAMASGASAGAESTPAASTAASTAAASTQSPHGPLNIACERCHTASAWRPIRSKPEFDHAKTGYPLRGHVSVACQQCHVNPVFSNVGSNCQDCHADLHRRKNGAQCEMCHRVSGWQVSVHDMNEHQDRFPLIGAHATTDCYSCHRVGTVGQFNRQGLSTECNSCHMRAYQQAKSPNHVALGYSTSCLECHSSFDGWMAVISPQLRLRK